MSNLPFIVCWTKWDRTTADWKPINKFQRCGTLDKAIKLKNLLLSQTPFVDVYITQEIKI